MGGEEKIWRVEALRGKDTVLRGVCGCVRQGGQDERSCQSESVTGVVRLGVVDWPLYPAGSREEYEEARRANKVSRMREATSENTDFFGIFGNQCAETSFFWI